ncbi:MAG: hypothetical protein ACNYPI_04920, partial [Arenicellales bacterium WSBS_2016_MAG_OTU3]
MFATYCLLSMAGPKPAWFQPLLEISITYTKLRDAGFYKFNFVCQDYKFVILAIHQLRQSKKYPASFVSQSLGIFCHDFELRFDYFANCVRAYQRLES